MKPQKADAISDVLLRMAQSGQVRQRVSEDQLIMLLDQVDHANASESVGKITVRCLTTDARCRGKRRSTTMTMTGIYSVNQVHSAVMAGRCWVA